MEFWFTSVPEHCLIKDKEVLVIVANVQVEDA